MQPPVRNTDGSDQVRARSNRAVVLVCVGVVAGMAALSYAAVPLYRLFCQVTGFGGTTQVADSAPDVVSDRVMTIRFDANTSRGLPWNFRPVQRSVEIRVGENKLAFYEAENLSDRPVVGTATFNVTPLEAGAYFSKIDCFCFTEQVLQPGQRVDMPVSYYVDPEIENDPDLASVTTITLSYTFFPLEDETAALEVDGPSTLGESMSN